MTAPLPASPGIAPPSGPAAAAALELEIDRCASREHTARLAVHLARTYAEATAIFAVRHDRIEGVIAEGIECPLAATLLPAEGDSVLARVAASGEPFRGAPPAADPVCAALGRADVREVAVLPVRLQGRVVSLLYADNGPEVLGDAAFAALGTVCTRVARAYVRLILERKARAARAPVAALGASLLRG